MKKLSFAIFIALAVVSCKKEPKTIAGIPIERAITILELWKENGSVPEIINYADGFEQGYKTRDKEYAKSFDTMIKIMEKKNETV